MHDFDPAQHLVKLKGKDYLEVKWRLVWLRKVHPDAVIHTDMVSHDEKQAVFMARVTLPTGAAATGWGSETPGDFGDYLEKAETKALGRALAALGFGTQFCDDHEFGANQGHIVDSPVQREQRSQQPRQAPQSAPQYADAPQDPNMATPRQVAFLKRLARESNMQASDVEQRSAEQFGKPVAELNKSEMSMLIDQMPRPAGVN
jgi:hypothetical protein